MKCCCGGMNSIQYTMNICCAPWIVKILPYFILCQFGVQNAEKNMVHNERHRDKNLSSRCGGFDLKKKKKELKSTECISDGCTHLLSQAKSLSAVHFRIFSVIKIPGFAESNKVSEDCVQNFNSNTFFRDSDIYVKFPRKLKHSMCC